MSLKDRICEELESSVTGKMSRGSLKKALCVNVNNKNSLSAFNAAINQLCDSGGISKIGGHSVCLRSLSGNSLQEPYKKAKKKWEFISSFFVQIANKARNSNITDPQTQQRFTSRIMSREYWWAFREKDADTAAPDILEVMQLFRDHLAQVGFQETSLEDTLKNAHELLFNCLGSGLVSFPILPSRDGKELIDLIREKFLSFWIVDSILHDTPISKRSSDFQNNVQKYRSVLLKASRKDPELIQDELESIFTIGLLLTEAHDFCNLISLACVHLLASGGNETIIEDYEAKFGENVKKQESKEGDGGNSTKDCNINIAMNKMETLLVTMKTVMESKEPWWSKAPNDTEPWMLNEKVNFVLERIRGYNHKALLDFFNPS